MVSDRSTTASVTAIIVNWNSAVDTLECVDHLVALHPGMGIVVVDNASDSGDFMALERGLGPEVELRRSPVNGGYASGVNRGLLVAKERGTRWAWLVNPDSRPRPGCLEELLKHSRGALALSPAQESSPSYDSQADVYITAAMIRRGRVTPIVCTGCSNGGHEVDVLTGTTLLLDVQASFGLGLLREDFFHYKEEYEFVERLGRLGKLRLVCSARTWHRRGASLSQESPAAEYYRVRNELLYLRFRSRYWALKPRTVRFVLRVLLRALVWPTAPGVRDAALRGIKDGLLGRSGALGGAH